MCVNERNYCPATLFAMVLNDRVPACLRDCFGGIVVVLGRILGGIYRLLSSQHI